MRDRLAVDARGRPASLLALYHNGPLGHDSWHPGGHADNGISGVVSIAQMEPEGWRGRMDHERNRGVEAVQMALGGTSGSMNIRKAAIILASLPREVAAQLLGRLKPKQLEAVSIEIARLGSVATEDQESAILEFAEANPSELSNAGGLELAQALVQQALGDKAAATLDNLRQSVEDHPFAFLRKVDSQNVLTYLMDEHPQTIALVLSHLPASMGAEIVHGLPTDTQLSVIKRVAQMGQTTPEIVKEVEEGLERRMHSLMNQSLERAGGIEAVAEILNIVDRSTERALLDSMADEDPELVEEIRRLMFVFDDISRLSDKDIQNLLRNVETAQWAMALKGANEELRKKIMGNMSQRAAQMLAEEIEYLGAVRLSEVEAVQQQIVDVVRRLEDAGEITTQSSDEEDEFVT
jgi:flagellar motor switch protein FliG